MNLTHEENRAALLRERDARKATYLTAIAQRDALVPFAQRADAFEFDRRELARAESRVAAVLQAMHHWKDPIPAAPAAVQVTAPAAFVGRAGAVNPVSEVDRLANEIVAAAEAACLPGAKTEAHRLADEIVAPARLAEA